MWRLSASCAAIAPRIPSVEQFISHKYCIFLRFKSLSSFFSLLRRVGTPKRLRASSTLTMAAPTGTEDQLTLAVLAGNICNCSMADIRAILADLEVWLAAARRHAELQPPEAVVRDTTFLLAWQATRAIHLLQEDVHRYGTNPAQPQEREQDDGDASDSGSEPPRLVVSASSSNEGVFFPEFKSWIRPRWNALIEL